MKRYLIGFLALSLVTPVALAATIHTDTSNSLSTPVADDLYTAGERVSIDQPIRGDAVLFGGNIRVDESISEDLISAGGNIDVNAPVADDIRIAGGTIRLNSHVGGDVIVTGGTVEFGERFSASGDVLVAGGNVVMNGLIGKNAKIAGGQITVNGNILGDASLRTGMLTLNGIIAGNAILSAETIETGENASLGGNVEYWRNDGEMTFPMTGSGQAIFNEALQARPDHEGVAAFVAGLYGAFTLFSILSTAIVIGLLVFLNRKYFDEVALQLKTEPGWNLLYGLLYIVCTPVVALLLMVTVFGIPLGLTLLALYVVSLFFLPAVASITITKWLDQYYHKNWNKSLTFVVSMGVFLIMRFLGIIPILGWLAKAIILLMALGALMVIKWKKAKSIL
jgi:cytoskeletal protein CcmA (bactofilin family)